MTTEPLTGSVETADGAPVDFTDFMAELAQSAASHNPADGPPPAIAAGTFALYPMPDGGLMFVTNIADGPMAGVKYTRINPGMIRAAIALAGGGKVDAVRSLFGRGRRRELPRG